MIRITAKTAGFRRCGTAHPTAPTEHQDDHFTKAQLAELEAEPELLVERVAAAAGGSQAKPNAAETIKLAQAASSVEELDKLAEGEERKTVLDAIAARRKELEA
jgi:methylphosphotriester-DNA--protein-cysteine methyltransferase